MISFLDMPGNGRGSVGVGTIHHVAFAVEDEKRQLEWRNRLLSKGARVTEVLDRKYFKSIYFREPNGLLLEIATIPPGFTVDETKERLGTSLSLPDWLEPQRREIEASLRPVGPLV
jgi:glyoxalase family protein